MEAGVSIIFPGLEEALELHNILVAAGGFNPRLLNRLIDKKTVV